MSSGELSDANTGTARESFFAPAGRADKAELEAAHQAIRSNDNLSSLLEVIPGFGLLLNAQRQIVAANRRFLTLLGCEEREILGRRPGEVVSCAHCDLGPDGCGTGEMCPFCSAVRTVLESQERSTTVEKEAHLELQDGSEVDLEVIASPVSMNGRHFTVCAMRDVTEREKARTAHIEQERLRIFVDTTGAVCHHLNQPLTALLGMTQMLLDEDIDPASPLYRRLKLVQAAGTRIGRITRKLNRMIADVSDENSGSNLIAEIGADLDRIESE